MKITSFLLIFIGAAYSTGYKRPSALPLLPSPKRDSRALACYPVSFFLRLR